MFMTFPSQCPASEFSVGGHSSSEYSNRYDSSATSRTLSQRSISLHRLASLLLSESTAHLLLDCEIVRTLKMVSPQLVESMH